MTIQPFKNAIAQNVLLFVVFTVFLFSCKKEPEPLTLPPATQTGENTFGCKVNGEVFVPNGNVYYKSFSEPVYLTEDSLFGFSCYNVRDFDCKTNIRVRLFEVFEQGLQSNFDNYQGYFSGCMGGLSGSFRINQEETNSVIISRFDLDERIVSGTFEYNLINDNEETLSITEGRFDVGDVLVY